MLQLIADHVLNQQLAEVRAPVLEQNAPPIQAPPIHHLIKHPPTPRWNIPPRVFHPTGHVWDDDLLDEPIPVATKRRLSKPLAPHPPRFIAPIHRHKPEKRKVELKPFDPYQPRVLDKGKDLKRHKLPLAIEENLRDPPQYILVKEARDLRDYGAVLPVGHRLEPDADAFLTGMKQNTIITLQDELRQQNGLKF